MYIDDVDTSSNGCSRLGRGESEWQTFGRLEVFEKIVRNICVSFGYHDESLQVLQIKGNVTMPKSTRLRINTCFFFVKIM